MNPATKRHSYLKSAVDRLPEVIFNKCRRCGKKFRARTELHCLCDGCSGKVM